jgi:hypothetical protein
MRTIFQSIISIAISVLLCAKVMAAPEPLPAMSITCTNTATSVTNDTGVLNAYINGFRVAISPTTSTATVSVATLAVGQAVWSSALVTGSSVYREPRLVLVDYTNGAIAAYGKMPIINDKLKMTVTSATTGSVTVTVYPVIERAP